MIDSKTNFDFGKIDSSVGDLPSFAVVLSDFFPRAVFLGGPDDFVVAADFGMFFSIVEFDNWTAGFRRVDGLVSSCLVFKSRGGGFKPAGSHGSGGRAVPEIIKIDGVPFEVAAAVETLMTGENVALPARIMKIMSREGLGAFLIARAGARQMVYAPWARKPDTQSAGLARVLALKCGKCGIGIEAGEPFCLICGADHDFSESGVGAGVAPALKAGMPSFQKTRKKPTDRKSEK